MTINDSKIVNWGRDSPKGGAGTHPRSQLARRIAACLEAVAAGTVAVLENGSPAA